MTAQDWNPELYARNARFVPELAGGVMELLAPAAGERILDLGCGDGFLTEKLVAAGARVTGIDASAAQVEAARARGIDAHVADARDLALDGGFDAVFSNATLHWVREPGRVIASVWRALRPGGRFVAEMGGAGNIARIVNAMESALLSRGIDPGPFNPWYFPEPDAYRALLEAQGFRVTSIALIPRPTPLPGDIGDWMATFAGSFTGALPPGDRTAFVDDVREALRPLILDAGGTWIADYVRLRFRAEHPS